MCIISDSECVFLSVLPQEPKKKREELGKKTENTALFWDNTTRLQKNTFFTRFKKLHIRNKTSLSRAWNNETLSEAFDAYYG